MNGLNAVVDYGASIWSRRYFWSSLVLLDLRQRYRRSALGIGWTLANPLAMTLVLCVVFRAVFGIDIRVYAPFVLSGMAFWSYISGAIMEGCNTLYVSEAYIRSRPAPIAIYSLRITLGLTVHFIIVFSLAVLGAMVFGGPRIIAGIPSLLPVLPMLFLLTWSLATIFGFWNVFFPDIQHVSTVAMQLLFYLTPVFCPPDLLSSRGLGALVRFNPLARILELIRAPLLEGHAGSVEAFLVALTTTLGTAAFAWWMIRKHEKTVIFSM